MAPAGYRTPSYTASRRSVVNLPQLPSTPVLVSATTVNLPGPS